LHFHNTRGLAQSNVLAAIDAGIDRFDASLGGLGGCPYAPGASGNACTEEVVHMLELEGFNTGVDLQKLVAVAAQLPALVEHDIPSQIRKAGHRLTKHPVPGNAQAVVKAA
jgi:hydroxymethylglutaryl-CoA lyase